VATQTEALIHIEPTHPVTTTKIVILSGARRSRFKKEEMQLYSAGMTAFLQICIRPSLRSYLLHPHHHRIRSRVQQRSPALILDEAQAVPATSEGRFPFPFTSLG
jgi:hypothetical protein